MRAFTLPLIAFAAFATVLGPSDHACAQSQFGDPNAEPAPFNPQMAALMSMLIQPRHAKLGLAGKAENWPLAAYAFRELKQGFAVTARAQAQGASDGMKLDFAANDFVVNKKDSLRPVPAPLFRSDLPNL